MKLKRIISMLLVTTTLISTLAFSVSAENAAEVMEVDDELTVSENKAKKEVDQKFVLSVSSYGTTGWTSDELVYFTAQYVGPAATAYTKGTTVSSSAKLYGTTSAQTAYLTYYSSYGNIDEYYKVGAECYKDGVEAKINVAWQP